MSNVNNNLKELRGSGFEIVDDEPNIMGWDVQDRQMMKVGKVNDLLFDPQSRKVRYVVMDLNAGGDKVSAPKVLIPIGLAELHPKDNDVILPGISAEQLLSLPEYDRDTLNPGVETTIRNILSGPGTAATAVAAYAVDGSKESDFYDHDHFNEDNFYKTRKDQPNTVIPVVQENLKVGKRVVETGSVVVKTSIAEVPVKETIQLKEEHITVERNVVDKPLPAGSSAAFEETTVQLKGHAEVPVVTKEARVVEEISVGKEIEQRDETINDSVRKTEIEVEDIEESRRTSGNTGHM